MIDLQKPSQQLATNGVSLSPGPLSPWLRQGSNQPLRDSFSGDLIQRGYRHSAAESATLIPNQPQTFVIFVSQDSTMTDTNRFQTDLSENGAGEKFPAHLYVRVPAVIKTFSLIGIAIFLLSLTVFLCTGFATINPIISILGAIASCTFYVMGKLITHDVG
jgi:hypothetical protein